MKTVSWDMMPHTLVQIYQHADEPTSSTFQVKSQHSAVWELLFVILVRQKDTC